MYLRYLAKSVSLFFSFNQIYQADLPTSFTDTSSEPFAWTVILIAGREGSAKCQ